MAEHLLFKMAEEKGISLDVFSCGVAADPSIPVPEQVFEALREEGIERFAHTPRPATRQLLADSDLVLVMTDFQRQVLGRRFPEFSPKIFALREYAGFPGTEIGDPIGLSADVYRRCLADIREALEAMLRDNRAVPEEKRK